MSEAIAFDTHRFVKRLTQTGFTEAQAEALADEQVILLNGNLATKHDLLELKGDLERQLAELKGGLERQLAEVKGGLEQQLAEVKGGLEQQLAKVKADMLVLKWMVGLVIVVQVLPLLKSLF